MIGLVHLQRPLDALHKAEEKRKEQDKNCNPKCIPLDSLPSVIPPLRHGVRFSGVEDLFQHDETVSPVIELLNLPVVRSESTASSHLWIETVRGNDLGKPFLRLSVGLGEQQCKSVPIFLYD
jgi:hypothetical protein